jgi:UDP-N-acetylglucosamine--N-acetylmuramyl-(pentapeptide) pyrophosphoryl-undecaprenol N-acetylglucosamine transferase
LKIIFAGGGTGGHLIAGLSIAEEITSRFPDAEVIFLGPNEKNESVYIERNGYKFRQIKASKLTSFVRLPVFILVSLIGIIHSLINIIKIRPDIIIGLGGYGSVLPAIAAYIVGVPVVLIEQNVIPGRANLLMERWVDCVLCHWEDTTKRFKKACTHVTGIPVRNDIIRDRVYIADNVLGLVSQKKTLLIMGGSQGAQAINKVMLQSIPRLKALIPDLQIIHLTGKHGYKDAKVAYDRIKVKAFVSEFLYDIGLAYGLSDVVICRAGANTTAEISEVGIPAIFVPYPYATDNHQYWNAYELAKRGGALIIKQEDLEPERVIELVSNLLMNDERLDDMRKINKSLSKPFAAKRVVDKIFQTLEVKKSSRKATHTRTADRSETRKYIKKDEPYLTKIL